MDQAQKLRNIIKNQGSNHNLARVVTVTSGKGGVGKTSISTNLAIALKQQGKRVVILDADFGLANIEVMLGIRPKYSLADMMFRGKKLADIVTPGPEGIGFISCGSGIQELTNLSKDQVMNLSQRLYELDEMADFVIIDTGAGISDNVMEFVMASSEVLLIATPEPTSITDAYALLKTLNQRPEFAVEHTSIKMIANRVHNNSEGSELYNKLYMVVGRFLNIELDFIGSIPIDGAIGKAVMAQKPFTIAYPNSPASKAVTELARMIVSQDYGKQLGKRGIAGLFGAVLHQKWKG